MGKENQKNWWAPIWTGLVIDSESSHYKKMKNAVWLYLYLVLNADRRTGFLARKIRTISLDTGIKERTIRKWLNALKRGGYIKTKTTGRYLYLWINKWKGFSGWHSHAGQTGTDLPIRVEQSCQSEEGSLSRKPYWLSQNYHSPKSPNDNTIKRDINNDKRALAIYLAESLDDLQNLPMYLALSKKYPEQFLKEILDHVKATPIDKIKKNRAALFYHLVKINAQIN